MKVGVIPKMLKKVIVGMRDSHREEMETETARRGHPLRGVAPNRAMTGGGAKIVVTKTTILTVIIIGRRAEAEVTPGKEDITAVREVRIALVEDITTNMIEKVEEIIAVKVLPRLLLNLRHHHLVGLHLVHHQIGAISNVLIETEGTVEGGPPSPETFILTSKRRS